MVFGLPPVGEKRRMIGHELECRPTHSDTYSPFTHTYTYAYTRTHVHIHKRSKHHTHTQTHASAFTLEQKREHYDWAVYTRMYLLWLEWILLLCTDGREVIHWFNLNFALPAQRSTYCNKKLKKYCDWKCVQVTGGLETVKKGFAMK